MMARTFRDLVRDLEVICEALGALDEKEVQSVGSFPGDTNALVAVVRRLQTLHLRFCGDLTELFEANLAEEAGKWAVERNRLGIPWRCGTEEEEEAAVTRARRTHAGREKRDGQRRDRMTNAVEACRLLVAELELCGARDEDGALMPLTPEIEEALIAGRLVIAAGH